MNKQVTVPALAIKWALAVIESDPRWRDDPQPLIQEAPGGSDLQQRMYQILKEALATDNGGH